MSSPQNETESSSVMKLVFAWAWVGLPLAWGITQTVIKALGLFQ